MVGKGWRDHTGARPRFEITERKTRGYELFRIRSCMAVVRDMVAREENSIWKLPRVLRESGFVILGTMKPHSFWTGQNKGD